MNEFDMYLSGMSIPEISNKTGVAKSTLRFRLKKVGILRSRKEGILNAANKGRLSSGKGKNRVFSDEWKRNISLAKLGKGVGFSLKPNGYIEHTAGEHKGRSVHVVAMEKKIGRRLFANEVVHHIDENRANNNIENLQLMTRADHARLHRNIEALRKKEFDYGKC